MKQTTSRFNSIAVAALMLTIPAAYFIAMNILKEFGVNGLCNIATPFLERAGIKESVGWNINLIILLGPVLAIALTIIQVLKIQVHFTKQDFQFHLSVRKRWFYLLIATFSAGLLAILFFYMLGENYNC
jgi:hypothetical protein